MVKSKPNQDSSPFLIKQISFSLIDVSFVLRNKTMLREWIFHSIKTEKKIPGFLSYNFCSDGHLLKINKEHLNHDYYTDIITFDLVEGKEISGDIYISLDRVRENAKLHHSTFHVELSRVMIHGVLHLCGYKDKSAREAKLMREKEDYYLSLLP